MHACIVVVLLLKLLALLPNQFASAQQNPKSMRESSLNEPIFEYYAQDGLDSKDLIERPADERREELPVMDREDYIQPDEELEDERQDYLLPQARVDSPKMKRWLLNRKQAKGGQKNAKGVWMFQTGATEGVGMSAVPADQEAHLRNRAVELSGAKPGAVRSVYDQATG